MAFKIDHSKPSAANQHKTDEEDTFALGGKAARLSRVADAATAGASVTGLPGSHINTRSHIRAANFHFDAADAHEDAGSPAADVQRHIRAGNAHEKKVVDAEKVELAKSARARSAGSSGREHLLMTSPRGARYYVNASGEKVYVK